MDRFAWAENNLCIRSPNNLRARGVNDYLAPNVSPGRKWSSFSTAEWSGSNVTTSTISSATVASGAFRVARDERPAEHSARGLG